jgi:ATP-dependent Clp protease ATP-binding subunit ClpA
MPFGKGIQFDRMAALAVFRARREAEALRSPMVGARHLLLGLLGLENGLLRQVFGHFGEDLAENITGWTRASLPQISRDRHRWLETKDWSAVILLAKDKAARSGTSLVTEAELVTALLELPTRVDSVLKRGGVTRQQCLELLQGLVGTRVSSEWRNSGFTGWTTDPG